MPGTRSQEKVDSSRTRSDAKRKAGSSRMPPLSTAKSKRSKPSGKSITVAKHATAESETKKDKPAISVKIESSLPKRRLWTDEEDLALCKACVNITTDPSVGTNLKGDAFWMRVQKKLCELYESESEVVSQDTQWKCKSVNHKTHPIWSCSTTTASCEAPAGPPPCPRKNSTRNPEFLFIHAAIGKSCASARDATHTAGCQQLRCCINA